MTQRLAVLLYPLALAGAAAGLFYALRSNHRRNAQLGHIRSAVEQIDARSHATYRLLKKQRRTLTAICDYLLPVTKGVEKPAS